MLESILPASGLTLASFLICTAVSVLLGLLLAALNLYRSKSSQSFSITLAMLPAAVQLVIMLVNGNIGAGVAVAGAFGLVRFRSAPGTAREITAIFLALAVGLATGMGYVALAAIFFLLMGALQFLLTTLNFGGRDEAERQLKITIPEDLEYEGLFDDLFEQYTDGHCLQKVRTTSMGTLYELVYTVRMKNGRVSKSFIDAIRCRNGNLNISCSMTASGEAL